MWVESLIGVPDARLLAVFPIVAGPTQEGPFAPIVSEDEPTYPIEQEFPDLGDWSHDPESVCALWMGSAFEYSTALLALVTSIPAVAWPPGHSSQARTQWIRGIGRIWVATRGECQDVIDRWMADAMGALSGVLHDEDRQHINKVVGFIGRPSGGRGKAG